MKVLSFGEVLWDIYPGSKHIGGAPLNFAAHFKKCGGSSWMLSAVGSDTLGNDTLESIEKLGVDCKYVFRSGKETGKCLVELDENRVPSYNLLDNVAYDCIGVPDISKECFDVLYFGTLALRNEYNRKTLKCILEGNEFSHVFVDLNLRKPFYCEQTVRFAMENATILKISEEELAEALKPFDICSSAEGCAKQLCNILQNVKLVIITRGENGSLAYDIRSGMLYECCAEKTDVRSTVGAGDSFSAAFLAMYLQNRNISQCLEFASKVSAFVVSKTEAIPDYDVNKFVSE